MRIFLACGATDMRKGFDGLAVMTQQVLEQSPHSGALFAFRGKRGDLTKLLWYDGQGMCLFSKRMDPRLPWASRLVERAGANCGRHSPKAQYRCRQTEN